MTYSAPMRPGMLLPSPCAAAKRLLFPLFLIILASAPARAIVFAPLSIERMTASSDLVLHGTIRSKTCQRDAAGRIYTRLELHVLDVWKGAISSSPFPIVHGGGTLGEEQSVVSGQVEYQVGEEVVAFLVRNARGEGVTVGLMQGKFSVWNEAVTGRRLVTHPFHSPATGAGLAKSLRSSADASVGPMELNQLKKQVLEGSR